MFSTNEFKKSIKQWIQENPEGNEEELLDFCEELIPPNLYTSSQWLVDQTMSWYKHVLAQRKIASQPLYDDQDVA